MTLEDLGYTKDLETYKNEQNFDEFEVGRVISEHKERYVVRTSTAEYDAEVIGNLRFTANSRSDFPAIGDWVAVSQYDDDKGLIHAVFPRKSIIEREAVGKQGEKQIIATNIDYALIVQAVDRDFNINRIERYLTICNTAKVQPIIVLNKIDLLNETELEELVNKLQLRIKQVPVVVASNYSNQGIERLRAELQKGKTYCLLGSSGVGKSTFVNTLSGKQAMKTNTISSSTSKGRHVTTHRELFIMENGSILIDNPGMREVGIGNSDEGLLSTFEAIVTKSEECKYKDCTHNSETGCAVRLAVEAGEIDRQSYENYLKMEREKEHFESTVVERRKKDKDFGKMVKNFKKERKTKKF